MGSQHTAWVVAAPLGGAHTDIARRHSLLTGSITAYVLVPPGSELTEATAQRLYIVLLIVAACGSATLLFIREPKVADATPAASAPTTEVAGAADREVASPSIAAPGDDMARQLTTDPEKPVVAPHSDTVWGSVVRTFKLGCKRQVAMVNLLLVVNGLGLSFYQVRAHGVVVASLEPHVRVKPCEWCVCAQGKYPQIVAGKDPLAPDLPEAFQPRLIAPFGEGKGFERPNSLTCSAEGVTVGSLKMAPIFAPAATASLRVWSFDASRAAQLRSKNSQALVSTWGSSQFSNINWAA